ncbi:TetR/AcrR family transcriptional regulator [Streptomyces sp. L7]
MALYRYFPDRDALLQAAADHVLEAMRRDPIPEGPWPDRLRAWMRAGQANLRPYPQLMPYVTTTRHPAWTPGLTRLREILLPARPLRRGPGPRRHPHLLDAARQRRL